MNKVSLRFVDITECELFLSRFFALEYDGRLNVKPEQQCILESIERSSKTDPVWRLPNNYIEESLKKLVTENELFLSIAPSLTLICDGCERASILQQNKQLLLEFTGKIVEEEIGSDLRLCLDLVLAVLSAVIDSCDVWSVLRFFGRVCPEILPPLRRKSQDTEGQLNIMSVLISYVMTAEFDDNKGDDPILSKNFNVIKEFTDTIVMLADEIQKNEKPSGQNLHTYCGKDLVEVIIKKAIRYLTSVRELSEIKGFIKVVDFLTKHLNEIDENFVACKKLVGDWTQARVKNYLRRSQEAYTNTHVFAFALRDRLVCMNPFGDLGLISPLFKTPLSTTRNLLQDVSEDACKTSKASRIGNRKIHGKLFEEISDLSVSLDSASESYEEDLSLTTVSNDISQCSDTSFSTTAMPSFLSSTSLEDSGIALSSSYDDNKENIDPRSIKFDEHCGKTTTELKVLKTAGLFVCDANQLNKLNVKHSKPIARGAGLKDKKLRSCCKRKLKSNKLEAGQTDLKRFFKQA
uniref:CUE domain-containing protein n=1 Tax=Syphacia muris TaxID=451379 RepID=A0A0N5AXV7_9BILA